MVKELWRRKDEVRFVSANATTPMRWPFPNDSAGAAESFVVVSTKRSVLVSPLQWLFERALAQRRGEMRSNTTAHFGDGDQAKGTE
ncbi:hypothetical protein Vi05172_g2943 [Venturia inaequalis]|nr:hypothetical protein Vi05172_g2943 [Venturia inaequalis]